MMMGMDETIVDRIAFGGVGEKHEETEYHRIVAWDKLAETCQQAPNPFLYGTER
jgi:single-stranded DNA-binding protein